MHFEDDCNSEGQQLKQLSDACLLRNSCGMKDHIHALATSPLASSAVGAHREGITGDQLKVDVADILSYNAELANYVLDNPTESLPLVFFLYLTNCAKPYLLG